MVAPINNIQNHQPNGPDVQQASNTGAVMVPFARSGKDHVEQGVTQTLASGSWAAAVNQTYNVPSYGFLEGLILTETGSGGVNGTTTVAASADAPWNLFSQIQLTDANGTPIWQLDGYAAYIARLLGGYKNYRPDQSTYGYTAISTGSSGTGNFKIKYELPMAFGPDGLGCLPNMDASAVYRLNLTFNGPTTFYSTSPGTVPGISGLLEGVYRSRPNSVDSAGNPQAVDPPAKGTVQYWTSQTFSVLNGQNTLQLSRVGNVIRNHIFIFRDSNGSRATADSGGTTPSVITFNIDSGIRYNINIDTQRQRNYEAYGFDVPAGVVAFPNTLDPTGLAGHEYGDQYLPTAASTNLKLQFTSTAAGTLQVLTNDFVPAGNIYPAVAGL